MGVFYKPVSGFSRRHLSRTSLVHVDRFCDPQVARSPSFISTSQKISLGFDYQCYFEEAV